MLEQIQMIIREELDRFTGDETRANALRSAAWFVMDDFPEATSADFADAAVMEGQHRQGSINRWNEALKNLKVANG
ncbi:hypothetical protein [Aminobacter phage Erebus]|nr:hypothetical protein [Aminobacter phage Erebus]